MSYALTPNRYGRRPRGPDTREYGPMSRFRGMNPVRHITRRFLGNAIQAAVTGLVRRYGARGLRWLSGRAMGRHENDMMRKDMGSRSYPTPPPTTDIVPGFVTYVPKRYTRKYQSRFSRMMRFRKQVFNAMYPMNRLLRQGNLIGNSLPGLQNYMMHQNLGSTDLTNMFRVIQNESNTNTDPTLKTAAALDLYIHKSLTTHIVTNQTTINVEVEVWSWSAKRDHESGAYSPLVLFGDWAWDTPISERDSFATSNPTATELNPTTIGVNPRMNVRFRQYYNIVRAKRVTLPPGGQMKFYQVHRINQLVNTRRIADNKVLRGIFHGVIIIYRGFPVEATEGGVRVATPGAARISHTWATNYTFKPSPGHFRTNFVTTRFPQEISDPKTVQTDDGNVETPADTS